MNDPHVEALFYRVRHGTGVDYECARLLEHDQPRFGVKIENRILEITMKCHHATVEGARDEVDPFLRTWEMSAALDLGPAQLEFAYDRATVIDRNPTPVLVTHHVIATSAGQYELTGSAADVHVSRSQYPDPPAGITCGADVELMYAAYCQYRAGERILGGAAYFCLTALEGPKRRKRRQHAASRYAVDETVLSKLGELTDNKGGKQARKAKGAGADFTGAEQRWLEEAMKRLIRRAAEVANDPSASRPQITMADLPSL